MYSSVYFPFSINVRTLSSAVTLRESVLMNPVMILEGDLRSTVLILRMSQSLIPYVAAYLIRILSWSAGSTIYSFPPSLSLLPENSRISLKDRPSAPVWRAVAFRVSGFVSAVSYTHLTLPTICSV